MLLLLLLPPLLLLLLLPLPLLQQMYGIRTPGCKTSLIATLNRTQSMPLMSAREAAWQGTAAAMAVECLLWFAF